ncbi:hypothetical protein AAV35_000710 [Salimicrobium jeotgali]|uniref:Uncharacterized protein n=2 Tax=Salimicrobium TaxID=351195 RepID=K2GJV2_9BACI|nr:MULTISPECIES: hypothetical protein [Salimicrobium]AKG03444.1 hypothetical protein AAV35_000710 [Salimicrobium jeotgali]EKE30719.1 hypothetical protein MJ3_12155 [Salimicrobium jeotgali]MBM7697152.1 hypothetical protein [Salimicrobium jeotgali]PBB06913.1 hypothetical protein CKW00_00180 [Salimicrobium humidisoli]
MRVTFQELFDLCRKVLDSCGLPDGCREDCAELITWSECVGYGGMKVLCEDIDRLKAREIHQIDYRDVTEELIEVEGAGFPDYVLAKISLDLVESQISYRPQTVHGVIRSSRPTALLCYEAVRIAKRGKGGLVHWKEGGESWWAFAFPGDAHPIVMSGEAVHDSLPACHHITEESYDYILQATTERKDLKKAVNSILDNETFDRLISYEEHEHVWNESRREGALVDEGQWKILSEEAKNVLVESSERSRLFGTGDQAR